MATEPILIITAEGTAAGGQPWLARWLAAAPDYWELTKPEVNFLILICTFAGFYLGYPVHPEHFPWVRLTHTLLGTLLVASGTGTLNQYLERRFDALMRRTAIRPLPAGRIKPRHALAFGTLLASAGAAYLAVAVSVLASLLAILTVVTYLFAYTPLKRKTPLCTLVGAFPGAIPPLIGWAAATGTVSLQALTIYALLFLWQFPHFMAIAWMYREDYAHAAYLVLPCENPCRFVAWVTLLPTLGLVVLSLAPMPLARAGLACRIGVLLLSSGLVYCGAQLVFRRSTLAARRLLLASIVYLPLVFVMRVADRLLGSS
jgi:heme o synthase